MPGRKREKLPTQGNEKETPRAYHSPSYASASIKPDPFAVLDRFCGRKLTFRQKEGFTRATSTFAAFSDQEPANCWNRLSTLTTKYAKNLLTRPILAADEAAFFRGVGEINRKHVEAQLVPLYKRYIHDRVAGRTDAEHRLEQGLDEVSVCRMDFTRGRHHDEKELRGLLVNDVNRAAAAPETPFANLLLRRSPLACRLQLLKCKPQPPPKVSPVKVSSLKVRHDEAMESRADITAFEKKLRKEKELKPKGIFFPQLNSLNASNQFRD